MQKKQIKMIIIAIIIIAIIAVAGYFLYDYFNEQKRINEVNEYKAGFYEGILCDYSCPLSLQNITTKNKTVERMLPALECIKACALPFKSKYANFKVTSAEINNTDNLIKDIDKVKADCIKKTTNMTSMSLDNVAYFNCSKEGLLKLKEVYGYLKSISA